MLTIQFAQDGLQRRSSATKVVKIMTHHDNGDGPRGPHGLFLGR